jgi:hypothetical protein
MHKRTTIAMLMLSVLGACGGGGKDHGSMFADRLTQGSWSKTLGSPPLEERYTYQFNNDGTYMMALFTDISPPPRETGAWDINTDTEGRTHLTLRPDDPERDCYYLACDSIAFFRDGALVVAGEPYVGEQPLERTPPLGEALG